jgi:hypothetical protein
MIIMAQGLRQSHGHLRFNHLVFFTLATIIFIWFSKNSSLEKVKENLTKHLLLVSGSFLVFLFEDLELIYTTNHNWIYAIWTNLTIYLFLYILLTLEYFKNLSSSIHSRLHLFFYFIFFLLLINLIFVLFASPKPNIDVFEYARLGADYLLQGVNPYLKHYPDLYKGKYDLTNGFCYWPLPALGFTLSRWIFTDVRFILVIFHVLAVWGLKKLVWNTIFTNTQKWLFIFLWLTFPVIYFVLEQSWVDIFILPSIFFTAYYLEKEKILKAALWIGIACAVKQYMIFMTLLFIVYIFKRYGFKRMVHSILVMTITTLTIAAPFLIWDYQLFFEKTVIDLLKLGFRDDALSWVAYFSKLHGIYINGTVSGIIYLITFIALIINLLKLKKIEVKDLYSSIFIIYMIVFLFGKQAFCNYYYMAFAILLTYVITSYKSKEVTNV